MLKVHGGTSVEDVKREVARASEIARQNFQLEGCGFNIPVTILFFDECNTSYDALWLCSEMMNDGTLDGQPVAALEKHGLKIAIACNPYKLHSPELIARLEKAGLGYHAGNANAANAGKAKDEDMTGENTNVDSIVQLRHLVYRVHPLPPSLRIHIYDFGSLSAESANRVSTLKESNEPRYGSAGSGLALPGARRRAAGPPYFKGSGS